MSNLNWPEGATHYLQAGEESTRFRDLSGENWKYFNTNTGKWSRHYFSSRHLLTRTDLIERPKQPKEWSGPEDGLPPVGTECEIITDDDVWEHAVILCHGYDDFRPHAVAQCASGLWMEEVDGFRAIRTPEQNVSETRESAIRELMDIAQVDCRVTAARLVDAGFRREGVWV